MSRFVPWEFSYVVWLLYNMKMKGGALRGGEGRICIMILYISVGNLAVF